MTRDTGGPEDGHTFHFLVTSRMSAGMVGEERHDADWWGPPWTLEVRAWSLRAACAQAALVPLSEWGMPVEAEDDDEGPEVAR